jgi:16S rRNA (uracil1498-N3)-methyltransferase
MPHTPHVLISSPWEGERLAVDDARRHHLDRVLRRTDGDPLSYTDGSGRRGNGLYRAGAVVRGEEWEVPRPVLPMIAVAPPAQRDRQRFLVEKLAELGAIELRWLRTRFGEGRPPGDTRTRAWCESALEQSRRAWLLAVDSDPIAIDELPPQTVFLDATGVPAGDVAWRVPCLAIGPEGGWAAEEVPPSAPTVSLGDGALRVETAAVAALAVALSCSGPSGDHSAW